LAPQASAAPGVVMGYERNVPTNTMLRKHRIEVATRLR
jgi:arginine deiminase